MSTLPLAINNYMKALERGVVDVEDHLQACLAGEYILRGLFATNPLHPIVLNPYIGVYDMFDVPTQARLARPRNWDEPEPRRFILEHEGRNYDFPQKHILAVQPHLRRIPGTPCVVNDLSAFRAAWDIFSGGALSSLRNWDNILVAGGSVLACLSSFPSNPSRKELFYIYQSPSYRQSDIDLFLWGMSEDQAKVKMQEIFEAVQSAVPWDVVCFRTQNTITIQGEYPKRPIQIIMRLYRSPAEILCGFDVDCCCVGYNGTNVLTNPRGLNAIISQCNRIDISRRSPSYEHRLAKYSSRGYEIYYPELQRERIDYILMGSPNRTVFPNGLGRLIVYEIIRLNSERFPWLYARSGEEDDHSGPVPSDRLRPSNYDYAWVKIPYGSRWWDVQKVKEYVEKVEENINKAFPGEDRGAPIHLHVMTCGTMRECLERCCSSSPPNAGEYGVHGFFSGPARFIVDDPGRQTVGSFNPSNYDLWESEAYIQDSNDAAIHY